MRLEHHLVGGYVRYISPHIIIIIIISAVIVNKEPIQDGWQCDRILLVIDVLILCEILGGGC